MHVIKGRACSFCVCVYAFRSLGMCMCVGRIDRVVREWEGTLWWSEAPTETHFERRFAAFFVRASHEQIEKSERTRRTSEQAKETTNRKLNALGLVQSFCHFFFVFLPSFVFTVSSWYFHLLYSSLVWVHANLVKVMVGKKKCGRKIKEWEKSLSDRKGVKVYFFFCQTYTSTHSMMLRLWALVQVCTVLLRQLV